jgi:hypothetical protein
MGWFWWWGKADERIGRGGGGGSGDGEREAQIEEGIRRVMVNEGVVGEMRRLGMV